MSSQDWRRSQASQRTIATVARQLEEVQRGSPLRSGGVGAGGIVVKGGSIRIEQGGNLEVDGAATFGGDTTVGGDLDVTGDATFSGSMAVTGTLSLPAGIIDNDALASPVRPATMSAVNGAAIPNAWATLVSDTINVPAGFTQAQIFAVGSVVGDAGSAVGTPSFFARCVIWRNEVAVKQGTTLRAYFQQYGIQSLTPHATTILTGLSGGTISVGIYGVAFPTLAGPESVADISASVTFLR